MSLIHLWVGGWVGLSSFFEATSHDIATPVLLSLLVCWRNSTPFFGMYALCRMKIGDFRFLFTDPPSPGVKVWKIHCQTFPHRVWQVWQCIFQTSPLRVWKSEKYTIRPVTPREGRSKPKLNFERKDIMKKNEIPPTRAREGLGLPSPRDFPWAWGRQT